MTFKEVNIKNRRATFDYAISDTFTAGLVLTGTEIKSIRQGKASLVDTFCFITAGEVWVKNMYIAEYFYGTYNNHLERRDRKLLLNLQRDTAARESGQRSRLHPSAAASVHQRPRPGQTRNRHRPRQKRIRQAPVNQRARGQTLDGAHVREIMPDRWHFTIIH